jgi:iron complex outermembrane recepter protein
MKGLPSISTFRHPTLYRTKSPSHQHATSPSKAAITRTLARKTKLGAVLMRITMAIAVACLIGGMAVADNAKAAVKKSTSIPAQDLKSALQSLATDRQFQILYRTEIVGDRKTSGAAGELNMDETLTRLLNGTGLSYRYLDDKTITILPANSAVTPAHTAPTATTAPTIDAAKGAEEKPTFWSRFRLAQADTADDTARASITEPTGSSQSPLKLEEVLVTAQKRQERLIDVPISIVALTAEELQQRKVTNIDDLPFAAPGVAIQSNGSYARQITMRGISNGVGGASLIGLYVDEASVTSAQSGAQLDLRTYDLERVEVLRGPQGTLYGEGSAGGTIRFITRNPQLDSFGVRADVTGSFTEDGNPGERVETMLNVPLISDVLGIRLAGTYEHGAGWIDQPAANKDDFNEQDLVNVRLKGLWQITTDFTANVMAVIHRNDAPPSNAEDANGNFTQTFNLTATPAMQDDYNLYNATLTYDFPAVRLLSTSSYLEQDKELRNSGTHRQFSAPPAPQLDLFNQIRAQNYDIFTQELRLTSRGTGPLQCTFGGFYRGLQADEFSSLSFAVHGAPISTPGISASQNLSDSWAAFGDASYKITPRFTLGAGLRYSEDHQRTRAILPPGIFQKGTFYSLNPRLYAQYQVSDQINTYASVAKGFRSGGFNFPAGTVLRPQYKPESIWTYELGMKGSLAEGRVRTDAAIFYSDYKDYQISGVVLNPPITIVSNAGNVEIKGVEWMLAWNPSDLWTLSFNGDYVHGEFVEINAGSAAFIVGDQIDRFPKYQYTVSGERAFSWLGKRAFARLDYNQQGRMTLRNRNIVGAPSPWYFSQSDVINMLNFNLNLQWSDRLNFSAYGQNLLNDRGYTSPNIIEELAARARPRTYGLAFGFTL